MATRRGKTSNPVPTATELVDMLEQHAEPVDERNIGTEAFLEVGGTGETRRYRLKPDLDARTRTRIEALAQEYLRQPNATLNILTPSTAQSVDRAVRSSDGWSFDGEAPQFLDQINRHTVEYVADGQTREAMRRSVQALNPRVADVWRLITATALEAWREDRDEPPPVWLDVIGLLEAMGFQKHHKGGYRPEHVQAAAEAIGTLCNLWVVEPMGTAIYPENPSTRRRKKTVISAARRSAVLLKVQVDELRDLFGNTYPMRWHVRAGPWIKDYPRQFGPMLKTLVELQATGTVNVWAKALGTELTFMQSDFQSDPADLVITVQGVLERAGLANEVETLASRRNSVRAREYFERALDLLGRLKLFSAWQYVSEDSLGFERAPRTQKYELWLRMRVQFTRMPREGLVPRSALPSSE
ncbi:MAG: hypothetical protein HC933_09415 [Pleurocapsa sp. SU_196_0]|nr:hypothetical protein [Pleurocapsa sp. SU_196_0]